MASSDKGADHWIVVENVKIEKERDLTAKLPPADKKLHEALKSKDGRFFAGRTTDGRGEGR